MCRKTERRVQHAFPIPRLAILIPSDQICGQLSNHLAVDQLKDPADLQLPIPGLGVYAAMHALFCAEDRPETIEHPTAITPSAGTPGERPPGQVFSRGS